MKITFLLQDLVSARLMRHSSSIRVKSCYFHENPGVLPCFSSHIFSIFRLLPDNHRVKLGIFLDINQICTDLSVRSRNRATGPGNTFTFSVARMILNWKSYLCKIFHGAEFFFFFCFSVDLTIYCICCWIFVHVCKTTPLLISVNAHWWNRPIHLVSADVNSKSVSWMISAEFHLRLNTEHEK